MPTPYLKKLSKQGKGSVKTLERKWDKAKDIAEKSDADEPYGLATHILQKMTGTKPKAESSVLDKVEVNAVKRLLASERK